MFPDDALNSGVFVSGNASSTVVLANGNPIDVLYTSTIINKSFTNATIQYKCDKFINQVYGPVIGTLYTQYNRVLCASDVSVTVSGADSTSRVLAEVIYTPYNIASSSAASLASSSAAQASTTAYQIQTNANLGFAVDLLIVVCAVLVVDLLRRVVFPSRA